MTNEIPNNLDALTQMERRILGLIAENKTSKEIANALFISPRTVQNHRYNISQKLNLKGSNKLLEFAIKNQPELLGTENPDSEKPKDAPPSRQHRKWLAISAVLVLLVVALYISARHTGPTGENSSSGAIADKNRMAVMPFRLIAQDSTDDYLSDGITEEMITQISKIPELRVIARTSVMQYKGLEKPLGVIADELQVGALLEGSVQKVGSLVRVSVRLIDTQNQENLWGQTYDSDFGDILTLQHEIALQVALALRVELYLDGLGGKNDEQVVNEDAHIAYLKGRYFVNQTTGEGFQRALSYYKEALRIDSTYARAWAGLADLFAWMANYGYLHPDEAFAQAKQAARKAVQLAPRMGEAHAATAMVALLYDWDFETAESEFQKAIELNPSDVVAHRLYALLQIAKGNTQKALEHTELAVRLDPLSRFSQTFHGRTLYFDREYEESIARYRNSLELSPDFWLTHTYLGESYLQLGDFSLAVQSLRKAHQLSQDNHTALGRLGYGEAIAGNREEAIAILNELIEYSQSGKSFAFQIALVHIGLGQKDDAFSWIEKAYENRHDFMLDLNSDPKLDPLRTDPRFDALVKKMGLAG